MIRINSLLTHPVARYASSTRPALLALHRISLCCSVRGVIEPPRSVRMTAEAHLALRIQRRWNEPHWWSGGGTEGEHSNDKHWLSGRARDVRARVFLQGKRFILRCAWCARRRRLGPVRVFILLRKHSLSLISLTLQGSDVAWGDTAHAALWWMIFVPPPLPWHFL